MSHVPFVSIIMAIRNEGKFIQETLQSIIEQDYPKDRYEVIIADGLSTDKTVEMICSMKSDPKPTIIDNPKKIVATGLNLALSKAKGEIIVRVDGHTLLAKDYIKQCVASLKEKNADNVGGKMVPVGKNIFGSAVALATSSFFGVGGGKFHYSNQEEWVDTVYLGAWKKEVFQKIGLFDEEMVRNQDDEFNSRLREGGGKILLTPKIKSTYITRNKPLSLARQYFQYGYWKVRSLQKHPKQMRWTQFVPPIFVFSILGSALLGCTIPFMKILFFFVVITYSLANLGVSLCVMISIRKREALLLPFIYTILHLSYGLGFLIGLLKFANQWKIKTSITNREKHEKNQTN